MSIFDLNKPHDLYRIIHEVYAEYIEDPTERNFFFLALGFTHLREWISESRYDEIKRKQKEGQLLTDGEKLFVEIYALSSFKIIKELCNLGKHHITRGKIATTSKASGLHVGPGKLGDKPDQTYFLIDGRDSRDYFIELLNKYNEWFANGQGVGA